MSNGLVETTLLGPPALTENGSPGVVAGNAYWRPPLDGEGERAVDAAERVGEGIRGVSREAAVVSFRVGDLCGGRSL